MVGTLKKKKTEVSSDGARQPGGGAVSVLLLSRWVNSMKFQFIVEEPCVYIYIYITLY